MSIDRRALAGHEALGLIEARVRGALTVLVEVGFLARYELEAGKRCQRTEGGLQCRAILHRFGEDYAVAFTAANARSGSSWGASAIPQARGWYPRIEPQRAPASNVAVPRSMPSTQLAQTQTPGGSRLTMSGEHGISPLEAAIERLQWG